MAHAKHDQVRRRYDQRCGYCGITEVDAGGELTVDHYQPSSAGGDDSDENLVYCCFRCNLYKGDFAPTAADVARGWRLLHPLRDDIAAHLRRNEHTGQLEALTETGRFHIALLHLNRPALVAHRLRQRLAVLQAEKQRALEAEIKQLHALLKVKESYITLLKRLLRQSPRGGDA